MYYAVRVGLRRGVYDSWEECNKYVKGVKGAEFRKFKDESEAWRYVNGENLPNGKFYGIKYKNGGTNTIVFSWEDCKNLITGRNDVEYAGFKTYEEADDYIQGKVKLGVTIKDLSIPTFYIDGSCIDDDIGFGILMSVNGKETSFKGKTSGYFKNISGEIAACCFTMHLCKYFGFHEVNIVYDFEGIYKWLSSEWKAGNMESSQYVKFFKNFNSAHNIFVHFYKVTSHTGNRENNLSDKLAKGGAKSGIFIPLTTLMQEEIDIEQCGVSL